MAWKGSQRTLASLLLLFACCQASTRSITLTHTPALGASDPATGTVVLNPGESFADYHVVVFLWVDQFYSKPYGNVALSSTGSFTAGIILHDNDKQASLIVAQLKKGPASGAWINVQAPTLSLNDVVAETHVIRTTLWFEWAGRLWRRKDFQLVTAGPGPNYYSPRPEDIGVTAENTLKLSVTNRDGKWWSTEAISKDTFDYGRFSFHIRGRIDTLDPNLVLGAFSWEIHDTCNGGCHHRELDFEFSRWGNPSNPTGNSQFVVTPFDTPGHRKRFTVQQDTQNELTAVLDWTAGRAEFVVYYGKHHHPIPSNAVTAARWTFTSKTAVHPAGAGTGWRFNLWQYAGTAPAANAFLEITSFTYTPAVPPTVVVTGGTPCSGEGHTTVLHMDATPVSTTHWESPLPSTGRAAACERGTSPVAFLSDAGGLGVATRRSEDGVVSVEALVAGQVLAAVPIGSDDMVVAGTFPESVAMFSSNHTHTVLGAELNPSGCVHALSVIGRTILAGGCFTAAVTSGSPSSTTALYGIAKLDLDVSPRKWQAAPYGVGAQSAPNSFAVVHALLPVGDLLFIGGEFSKLQSTSNAADQIILSSETAGLAVINFGNASSFHHTPALNSGKVKALALYATSSKLGVFVGGDNLCVPFNGLISCSSFFMFNLITGLWEQPATLTPSVKSLALFSHKLYAGTVNDGLHMLDLDAPLLHWQAVALPNAVSVESIAVCDGGPSRVPDYCSPLEATAPASGTLGTCGHSQPLGTLCQAQCDTGFWVYGAPRICHYGFGANPGDGIWSSGSAVCCPAGSVYESGVCKSTLPLSSDNWAAQTNVPSQTNPSAAWLRVGHWASAATSVAPGHFALTLGTATVGTVVVVWEYQIERVTLSVQGSAGDSMIGYKLGDATLKDTTFSFTPQPARSIVLELWKPQTVAAYGIRFVQVFPHKMVDHAIGSTAVMSPAADPARPASNVVDGIGSTRTLHDAVPAGAQLNVTLDLGTSWTTKNVTFVLVRTDPPVTSYSVATSHDNAHWATAVPTTNVSPTAQSDVLVPTTRTVAARYWKLTMIRGTSALSVYTVSLYGPE